MSAKIFLPNLTPLRGFASLMVLFHHIELNLYRLDLPSSYKDPFFNLILQNLGEKSVTLFFCLSGFLISFLLLTEKATKNKLEFAAFYQRRARRLLPLYWIVFLVSFVIVPLVGRIMQFPPAYSILLKNLEDNYIEKVVLYLAFLEDWSRVFSGPLLAGGQTWSLQYEWYFYLLLPLLITKYSARLPFVIFILLAVLSTLRALSNDLEPFIKLTPPFSLGLGVLFAQFAFMQSRNWTSYRTQVNKILGQSIILLTICIVWLVLFLFSQPSAINNFLFILISLIMIYSFSIIPKYAKLLESKWSNYLGEISYSLYMIHPLVIVIIMSALSEHRLLGIQKLTRFEHLLYYAAILPTTFLFSHLCYRYIEMPFRSCTRPKRSDSQS